MTKAELLDLAEAADLLMNISGHLTIEPVKGRVPREVYLDDDPGFTQFWAAGATRARISGATTATSLRREHRGRGLRYPTGGIHWHPTRPPVVLELWPVCATLPDRFTTVASWRGAYGTVDSEGVTYGHEGPRVPKVRRVAERDPPSVRGRAGHPSRRDRGQAFSVSRMAARRTPGCVAEPAGLPTYMQRRARVLRRPGIYVETRSGWFSDRTVRYLASGKPALVAGHGLRATLPVGEGCFPSGRSKEAVPAPRRSRAYEGHCAARAIAQAALRLGQGSWPR